MAITGQKRQEVEFETPVLYVGLAEVDIIAINPDKEEYEALTGRELKEDSKAVEYLGESKDGNTTLRLDFWMEEIKTKAKFKNTIFLEDTIRVSQADENNPEKEIKTQYINSSGATSWVVDENDLLGWFKEREYQKAHKGEEELFKLVNTWLGALDKRTATIDLEWNSLMKGKIKHLREHINGEFTTTLVILVTIKQTEKDGEFKNYQNTYSKEYLPNYCLRFFRTTDYTNPEERTKLLAKDNKSLNGTMKTIKRFIGQIYNSVGGCKDFFILKDMKVYDPQENIVASNSPILQEDELPY